ncbi:MAG: hypothetical protein ACRDSJ_00145 [Rubrobacteraceae bacterium]
MDPDAVRALRPSIEQDEPEWVERVKRERAGYWNVESTAYWSEVPLQATLAILLNLYERGDLKTDDDR